MTVLIKSFPTEASTLAFAATLAAAVGTRALIFLYGPLGAGKTTFTRGLMRGLGYEDKVKSPTYTLVEPYSLAGHQVYHFDLYRLNDVNELEMLGVRDYFSAEAICLIEWPEKGAPVLPAPDLACHLSFVGEGRALRIEALSSKGEAILEKLS